MSLEFELVEELGMSFADVRRVVQSAPARYYVFEIDKRSGGKRTIAQPARELKAIQRYVLEKKLSLYRVHPSAMAYKIGSSIIDNAEAHLSSGPILKLDFTDFFPSIKVVDWQKYARKNKLPEVDIKDLRLYSNILFWSGSKKDTNPNILSIGAPTSPCLSNVLMYDLDSRLFDKAEKLGIVYTRYADDITVSSNDTDLLKSFETFARNVVQKLASPKLHFNEAKRHLCTTGSRRSVTGLILTPEGTVSIGRDRKRRISAMLHHLSFNQLSEKELALLKGLLGFCISVEVVFVERMRVKYGNDLVDKALKYRIPRRGIRSLHQEHVA